jgi:4-hydroxy-tetrahydrodipicolinate reductase
MNYVLVGHGRMGKAIDVQAAARGHRRVAIIDPAAPGDAVAVLGRDRIAGADVAFEFTEPAAAAANVAALLEAGLATVCGTTGWEVTPRVRRALDQSSAGLVLAPNFSVGMNLFFRIVDHAARLCGALRLYEPFVHEAHHRGKKDVPSGTAKRLASIVLEADPRVEAVCEGHPRGALADGTLQVVGLRAGREPGSHTVGFDGEHDKITLCHGARSREGFALGAVLAAEWLGRRRGLHGFDEVLQSFLDDARKEA